MQKPPTTAAVGQAAANGPEQVATPAAARPASAPGARRGRGMTLIELMTAVALLALLSTLAAPGLSDFMIRNRTSAIANEFTATVLRARSEAVNRNSCVTVCRTTFANSPAQCESGTNWTTGWIAFANPDCSATTTEPAAADIFLSAGPFDSKYTMVSNGTNADRLMFASSGNARAGDAGRFDLQFDGTGTNRNSNRGLCLSMLGRTHLVAYGATCP
jgi:type IV fimbrial biogenesis protein FimT